MSVFSGRRLAMYCALCAVWGSTWLVIKVGLRDLPPLWFAGLRMALACVVLAPFALRAAAARRDGDRRRARSSGPALSRSASTTPASSRPSSGSSPGLAALLFSTFPVFVGVLAHFMLPDEPLTPRMAGRRPWASRASPSSRRRRRGDALLAGGPAARAGGALVLISSLVAAYRQRLHQEAPWRRRPRLDVWGQTLAGSTFMLILAAVFERGATLHWTPSAVTSLLYLAILGTALPFVGLFWLLRRVPVAVIGTIPIVDTVIASCSEASCSGESFSPRVLGGGASSWWACSSPAPRAPALRTGRRRRRPRSGRARAAGRPRTSWSRRRPRGRRRSPKRRTA